MCKSHMGNTRFMHTRSREQLHTIPKLSMPGLSTSQSLPSFLFIPFHPLTTYAPWPAALTILNLPLFGGRSPPWTLQISVARSRGRTMAIRLSVQGDFVNWPTHFAPFPSEDITIYYCGTRTKSCGYIRPLLAHKQFTFTENLKLMLYSHRTKIKFI